MSELGELEEGGGGGGGGGSGEGGGEGERSGEAGLTIKFRALVA